MKCKITRLPFLGHFDKSSTPLETVHADICGPITPSTNSRAGDFLTLVDQATGYISITLLKNKGKAFNGIKLFKSFFENQMGMRLKKTIINGGGEFIRNKMKFHLSKQGIQHTRTSDSVNTTWISQQPQHCARA